MVTVLDSWYPLDRSTLTTDRADDTVLTILDPVAITDADTFRWGEPPHVYERFDENSLR